MKVSSKLPPQLKEGILRVPRMQSGAEGRTRLQPLHLRLSQSDFANSRLY